MDSTPITTRQLEALVRLCQARAKMELRDTATEQDAVDVVELMKESLFDTFADDAGVVDFGRSSGNSKSKEVKKLKVLLYSVAEQVRYDRQFFHRHEFLRGGAITKL